MYMCVYIYIYIYEYVYIYIYICIEILAWIVAKWIAACRSVRR